MWWLDNVLFFIALFAGTGAFAYQVWQISRVIRRGRPFDLNTTTTQKIKNLIVYGILQKKMFKYPPVGVMHILTVAGFFIINLEMIEIIAEALTETKRPFQYVLGEAYPLFIAVLEILAVIVAFAMLFFLFRRLVLRVPRLSHPDLDKKSHLDANMILVAVFFLMVFILLMNAADYALYLKGEHTYAFSTPFLVTSWIAVFMAGMDAGTLHFLERLGWWGHNLLMFALAAYLPRSKHLHMFFSFVNTALTPNMPRGKMLHKPEIKAVIESFLTGTDAGGEQPERFGARDVLDLPWKSILDAFTCTECGRCTAACPANQTGKKLSPRRIMMMTRDRAEDYLRHWRQNGWDAPPPEGSLFDYISEEEINACTTCAACVEECPVNINPLMIILEMRRHIVLDEGRASREWTIMFQNVENNGAPWQFPPTDRDKWARELQTQ